LALQTGILQQSAVFHMHIRDAGGFYLGYI
jgi:hypothetical protein